VAAGTALALSMASPATAAVGELAGDVDAARANVVSLDALSITDGSATLSFTYTCTGAAVGFLWVSLKQPQDGVAPDWNLNSEGTSSLSKAWDSMHTAVPCSGTSKPVPLRATMTVTDEYTWFDDEPLSTGPTFVQLCLTMPAGKTDAAPGFMKQLENESMASAKAWGLALNYSWVNVS
jgi:hypothetical protein